MAEAQVNGKHLLTPLASEIIPYAPIGDQVDEAINAFNEIVDSRYKGNQNLRVLEKRVKDGVQIMAGSNPLILPIFQEVFQGYGAIRPEELERVLIAGDSLGIKGNHYVDLGLVLDFSRKNHDLAVRLFESLPKELRDLDRLPGVLLGYGLENSDVGNYGVAPTFVDGTELRAAKILLSGGSFSKNDKELLRTGLPSRLYSDGERSLFVSHQYESELENIGFSRLFLDDDLDLNSYYDYLSNSSGSGRGILVSGEASAQK